MPELWRIDYNSPGLRGFVGELGRDLEEKVRKKFQKRVKEDYNISVKFGDNNMQTYFALYLVYSGQQNNHTMEFTIEQKNHENPEELVIDRFPGVSIHSNSNWASPMSGIEELRNAADMSDEMDRFLEGKFGKSVGERGNGCPLYRTKLPEKYLPKPTAKTA